MEHDCTFAFSDLLSGVTSSKLKYIDFSNLKLITAVGGYREDPGRTAFGLSKGMAYFYITLEFLTTMTTWMNISLFAMLRYLCICLDKDFKCRFSTYSQDVSIKIIRR